MDLEESLGENVIAFILAFHKLGWHRLYRWSRMAGRPLFIGNEQRMKPAKLDE